MLSLPKINFFKVRRIVLLVLAIAIIFSGGYALGASGLRYDLRGFPRVTISRVIPPGKENLDFSLFWKVWDTLTVSYFDKSKLNTRGMVYGAIKGMVAAIGDPYTAFLPPEENRVTEEDLGGSFEGVGIQIGFRGTQLSVLAPLPKSPAELVGVKAGDYIIGIKDEAKKLDIGTVGLNIEEAIQAIRGPAGSKVTLTLLRNGQEEPIVVDIVRKKIDVPSVTLSYVGDSQNVANLKLSKFGGETNGEWKKAISEIVAKSGVDGVILDLRNNPGGYLEGAVDIASEFLKSNSLVVIEERANGQKKEYRVKRTGLLLETPIVVLTNRGSASASEILAGALRDTRGVKLVGETTFGKGTIQDPIQLEGGSGLHITIARWLTPSGFWVNDRGLEPDVKIEDDEKTEDDEQLQRAIEVLKSL